MAVTLRTAAVVCLVPVAMLAAPAASADNQSYLSAVSAAGLTADHGDDGMLKVGKGACYLLAPHAGYIFGILPDRVADIVWQQNPQLEHNQAAIIVNAAIDNLCPGSNAMGQYANVG